MTLLCSMPLAQPLPIFASATTSDPIALAQELWAPEVQNDPKRLLEKLRESIESDVYPTGREELLNYIADNRSSFRAFSSVSGPMDLQAPRKVPEFHQFSLVCGAPVAIGIAGYVLPHSAVASLLVLAGYVIPAGLSYVPYMIRSKAKAIFDKRFDDLSLMQVASSIATFKGDRILENHFNALWAQEAYEKRFQLEESVTERHLAYLVHDAGSIHAYHYFRLFSLYSNTGIYETALDLASKDFDDSSYQDELNGDESSRDRNLIHTIHSEKFRQSAAIYLEESDSVIPDSFRAAASIIEQLRRPHVAAAQKRVRVDEAEEIAEIPEEDSPESVEEKISKTEKTKPWSS